MTDIETTLRRAMEHVVQQAPTYESTYAAVVQAARRRRRRTSGAVGGMVVVAAVAAGVSATQFQGQRADPGDGTTAPARSGPTSTPTLTPQPSPADRLPRQGQAGVIARTVRESIPATWRLALSSSTLPGEIDVDGWADDGAGRSRVYVVHSYRPGSIQTDPCSDPEFVAGGNCTGIVLADGARLFTRGEAGTRYTQVMAVLRHPDGTGVYAESDNGWLSPGSPTLQVTRDHPALTANHLATIVQVVDKALGNQTP